MENVQRAYMWTVALLLTVVVWQWSSLELGNGSIGGGVFIAGMVGGFISSLSRGIDAPETTNAPLDFLLVQRIGHLLLGGILAFALYLMFMANVVSGELFPNFPSLDVDSFKDFVKNSKPSDRIDYAKALVWGVIAGYSQKFVPNIFDSLVERVSLQTADSGEQEPQIVEEESTDNVNDAARG